jgi:hypothetical protein
MKKTLLTFILAFAAVCAHAGAPEYVATVRLTPGASPSAMLAFQNTSSDLDVVVQKIEITNASTMSVTSGLMQFWVYGSTSMTHSQTLTAASAYTYNAALGAKPSYISLSSAPVLVIYEGDSSSRTAAQMNSLSGVVGPILRPLIVNADESAAANLYDSWSNENPDKPLILPHASNRGLVFVKRQLGSSDYTDGQVIFRIVYTVR